MTNFFEHFKTTLFAEFEFLKDLGFSNFEEKQIAYEYHFVTKSGKGIEIDFQIEMTSSTPIWTSINGIYVENLFESNSFFKEYSSALASIYSDINASKSVTNNQKAFAQKGFILNERYLRHVKSLLLDNPEYLQDPSIYLRQHELAKLQADQAQAKYLKDFKKLFDNSRQMLPKETVFKAKFKRNILTVATGKLSADFKSYDEFAKFLNSYSTAAIDYETILYKFEPK